MEHYNRQTKFKAMLVLLHQNFVIFPHFRLCKMFLVNHLASQGCQCNCIPYFSILFIRFRCYWKWTPFFTLANDLQDPSFDTSVGSRALDHSAYLHQHNSMKCLRRDRAEFNMTLKNGVIRFNETDHLLNCGIGEGFPLMYGKRGMKTLNQWRGHNQGTFYWKIFMDIPVMNPSYVLRLILITAFIAAILSMSMLRRRGNIILNFNSYSNCSFFFFYFAVTPAHRFTHVEEDKEMLNIPPVISHEQSSCLSWRLERSIMSELWNNGCLSNWWEYYRHIADTANPNIDRL